MEMDKCDLFLTPPFFYIYLFIYFMPYESLWPAELRQFTVVFMCVCACFYDPKDYDETKLVLL